jgi:hypothetical protein
MIYVGLALVAITAPGGALRAQSAAETLQQKVSLRTEEPAPAAASTSDADLGDIDVVQRYPKPDMFTLSVAQQFFYTDNVFYTHHDVQGAGAYLGSYSGSFVPYSLLDWTPRLTLQENMVRYGGVPSADFDNQNAAASSQYIFGADRSWTWTASATLARFTAVHGAGDHEFYKEVVYDNQVSHAQQLMKDVPLFLVAAYDLAYHQANPSGFDRLDNTLSLSLVYYPVPELSISPFFRPSGRVYFTDTNPTQFDGTSVLGPGQPIVKGPPLNDNTLPQHDRHDLNLSAGIDVTYTPIKYLSVSADFDLSRNYSNNSGLSYDQSSPGLSLTGTYKF